MDAPLPATAEVDRLGRDELARVLAAYMGGEIDNFEFDEKLSALSTKDRSLRGIQYSLWFVYDDLKRHHVHGSPERWKALRRTLAFLKSDLVITPELPNRSTWFKPAWGFLSLTTLIVAIVLAARNSPAWIFLPAAVVGVPGTILHYFLRHPPTKVRPFHPFKDEAEWRHWEATVDNDHLPTYEPALHGRPLRTPLEGRLLVLPGYLMLPLILVPLGSLLFLLPRYWQRRSRTYS